MVGDRSSIGSTARAYGFLGGSVVSVAPAMMQRDFGRPVDHPPVGLKRQVERLKGDCREQSVDNTPSAARNTDSVLA
jgi:hypothetical protein